MRYGGTRILQRSIALRRCSQSCGLPLKQLQQLQNRQCLVKRNLTRWSSTQAGRTSPEASKDSVAQPETTPSSPLTDLPSRQWSTPLAKTIAQAIEVTGPISIASYMRQCLTNPDGGYYTTNHTSSDTPDQFGRAGDFITSPEISQIFGELVGIWFMTEWMAQGRPREGVQFIEMGPGRGTLMSDMLRTIGQFTTFANAIQAVWLVEAGEALRHKQKDTLCGQTAEIKEVTDDTGKNKWWEATSKQGIPVRWVEDIVLLPERGQEAQMPFIIAHEFFDALPIHAFESVAPKPEDVQEQEVDRPPLDSTSQPPPTTRPSSSSSKVPQWRELLVAPTKPTIDLGLDQTTSSSDNGGPPRQGKKDPTPDFQLTLAKSSNPASLVIPERARYKALKNQVSSRVEISPESSRYVRSFARLIGGDGLSSPSRQQQQQQTRQQSASTTTSKPTTPSGAALIIDYGPLDTVPVNSLRAIRKHQIVSPFVHAGAADISADVDFGALADTALEASLGVEVHGPVEQGMWLLQLGIQERAQRLVKNILKTAPAGSGSVIETEQLQKKIQDLEAGWKRLVEGGPRGMGKAYKVMTILPENGGKRRPVGFGGGVVGG
ncbi:hypothetical protein PV10_07085 [Exophiala mesophila]|uniref:type II protein arginine methyltransferase n=1 Tax=Exophiala mesophila TaxID=212818 RepID=A0A0D1Z726_EXOME|nr:uncharacterized protein PV10_07085 [Exophiala mesophila]KIV89704.1 hypothetical protein PV10_07085 [Exophiala mesophila]